MVPRAYVVAGLVSAAVLGTLVLSATASRPLFGASHPFVSKQPAPPPQGRGSSTAVGSDGGVFPHWLFVSAIALLGFYALGLLLLIVLHRRAQPKPPTDPAHAPDDEPAEADWSALLGVELGAAAHQQLADIDLGTAREVIIACWLRLHRATQRAGLEASPAETPQEFTERTLRTLQLDERSVTTLATLYREARFSAHHMNDGQRAEAAAALRVLAGQLEGRPVLA